MAINDRLNISFITLFYGGMFIGLIFALPLVLHYSGERATVIWLMEEDQLYESMGAFFSLIAGIIFLYSYLKFPLIAAEGQRRRRNIYLLLLGLFLLFLFAEEISWGQRLFNIDISEKVAALNFQGELNLHNNKIFQDSNNSLATYGAKLLLLYLILPPVLFLLFPKVWIWKYLTKVPFTSLTISILSLFNYILLKGVIILLGPEGEGFYSYRISEAYELNLEMLLFIFSYATMRYLSSKVNAGDKDGI